MRGSVVSPGRGAHRSRVPAGAAARVVAAKLTLVRDPLRLLLFFLTIVTISRVHLHYPVLAALRPVLLLSLCAAAYAFLHPVSLSGINVLRIWPMRVVALLGVLACLSAPFGISLGNSALFILDSFIKTLAYAFLVALSIRHVRDLYTYVWAFVVSCGILGFFAVFVFGLSAEGSQTARLGELYTYDSNDLGVLLMIGLPLTLLLLFVDRGVKRLLLVVNLVAIAAAMARSGSRGGFLGLVAVGVAALFLVSGVSVTRRLSLLAATLLALALAAPPGYWKQMRTILSPTEDYNYSSVDGRSALIKRGLGYMEDYPVFGIGIWNFAKAECTISPKIADQVHNGPLRCVAPHNSFVQAGSELGVPGLITWLVLVLGLIVSPLRMRRRLPRHWRVGSPSERFVFAAASFFPLAMIGFAVTSFFVTFAFADPIYLMAAFTTGLIVATRRLAFGGAPQPRADVHRAPGWRVRQSAARFIEAVTSPAI